MFQDRTVYDREALTVLTRVLRKTLGRRRSLISNAVIWIFLAVCFTPILLGLAAGGPLDGPTVVGISCGVVLALETIFRDQVRGWLAWRRGVSAMREMDCVFDDGGFTLSIRNARSRWEYDAFRMVCETDRYFVFLVDERHGMLFDKSGLSGGGRRTRSGPSSKSGPGRRSCLSGEEACAWKGGGDRLKTTKIFSFFSGSGLLDHGFETEGYEIVMVNEIDPAFMTAYKYAREHLGIDPPVYGYSRDVNEFLGDRSGELRRRIAEVHTNGALAGFIGGPPCPDFSIAGKQRGREGDNGRLSLSYVTLIIEQRPDFFLFENVKGLWQTAKHRTYYEELKRSLADAGYIMTDRLTNALEFGAPQDRDRILLFGIRRDLIADDPNVDDFPWTRYMRYTIGEIKALPWPTMDDFAEDSVLAPPAGIPVEMTVQRWFEKNDVEHHPNAGDRFVPRGGLPKMRTIREGDDSRKSYKRLHRWRYSPTVAYGNNEVHLHPYKARRISVAEAASLQTLPKEFIFPPKMALTAKYKTIGNGVPCMLASAVAHTIRDHLKERGLI